MRPSTISAGRRGAKRLRRTEGASPVIPARTCVGCRRKFPQSQLLRFVRRGGDWVADARRREPGRGAYLCSAACGARVAKNKRYPGLSAAAERKADELRGHGAAEAAEDRRERHGDR
ncbi:MAG TPA: DUF448 domain-containing protein [Candidatus Dormibacteraeota bacterium]|nr:DUF448 domain-containing protein [Candidatus Dormibacteraeota bacterium]